MRSWICWRFGLPAVNCWTASSLSDWDTVNFLSNFPVTPTALGLSFSKRKPLWISVIYSKFQICQFHYQHQISDLSISLPGSNYSAHTHTDPFPRWGKYGIHRTQRMPFCTEGLEAKRLSHNFLHSNICSGKPQRLGGRISAFQWDPRGIWWQEMEGRNYRAATTAEKKKNQSPTKPFYALVPFNTRWHQRYTEGLTHAP